MPAPIEAGHAAIYLEPNSDGGAFSVVWRDSEGAEVPFEPFQPAGSHGIFLRPEVVIEPGSYTLVYSDECTPGPLELPLLFVSGPPPPPSDQLGELVVQYEAYCFGETNSMGYSDFPPLASVQLAASPDAEPYLPFMRVVLRDDTGTIDYQAWGAARGVSASARSRCGSLSPSFATGPPTFMLPTGSRTFTLEAEILDGPRYELSTVAEIECAQCDAPFGGGAGGEQATVDAGNGPLRRSDSTGCALADNGARAAQPALFAMLIALAALRRRRR